MQKAYLRELHLTNQCELVFPLKIPDEATDTLIIDEEIRSVRQITDNVQSLLQHTTNKINKILSQTTNAGPVEINPSLTANGQVVQTSMDCNSLMKLSKKVVFHICGEEFEVIINAPLVQAVALPSVLYADHVLQPLRFKTLYCNKKLCEFYWYASTDKATWVQVGTSYKYKPTSKDLNKFLKFRCIPKNSCSEGPPYEVVSEMFVQNLDSVPECPFQRRQEHTKAKLTGENIRILCYNILSCRYSETNAQFPYCSPQALSVDYRKRLIMKELPGYKADIMCLQEVDFMHYLNYFKPKLSKHGYKGVFHKKGNQIPEGLACFYDEERFLVLDSKQVVFRNELRTNSLFKQKWNLIKNSDTLSDCLLKQPTSLQVTILKLRERNKVFVIGNTHLYYHSEANDIRLLQAGLALDYLSNIYNKLLHKNISVSVLFCGDFNSIPTSPAYKFISEGVLNHDFLVGKEPPLKNINFTHTLNLASACGTPKYTNYTADFKGCLDYIFYGTKSFTVTNCVPFPTEEELSEFTALPSKVFPSDHVALVADLRLIN